MKALFLAGVILLSSMLVAQDETTPAENSGDEFSILDNLSTPDGNASDTTAPNPETTPGPAPTAIAEPTDISPVNETIPNLPENTTPEPTPMPTSTPTSAQSFTIEEGPEEVQQQEEEPTPKEEKEEKVKSLKEKEEEEENPQGPTKSSTQTSEKTTSPTWEQERYENDLKLIEANLFNDDINLTEKNQNTGLYTNKHNTSDDYLRFTMQFQFNPNVELNQFNKLAAIRAFEFQLAQNVFPFWYEFFFGLSNFDLTQTTDLKFKDDQYEALISFGAGISYRFRLFQNYFNDERYFETVHVFATYNMLNLTQTSEYYTGLGYRAEFGAHKRINIHNHIGMKFTYHLAPLQEDTQRKKQMTLSWVSVGFDWSYYF